MLLVIVLFGVLASVILRSRTGSFDYWEQEGAVTKLSELVNFLYFQAITDGQTYKLEFDLSAEPQQLYRIGTLSDAEIIVPDETELGFSSTISPVERNVKEFLNPRPYDPNSLTPPANLPSFRKDFELPVGMYITDIVKRERTYFPAEQQADDLPGVVFLPRGYAEFTVIHLRLERRGNTEPAELTMLVNPFTGLVSVYREYREFKWNFNQVGQND